jgi:transcriptional regulator with XRE-family HTH domain
VKKGQARYAGWQREGFPLWLQEQLAERSITITELGRRMGTPGTVITRWMQGKNLPDPRNMTKLADVLQISYDEVWQAAGLRPAAEPTIDPRRAALLRRIQDVALTPERIAAISGLLTAFETSDLRDDMGRNDGDGNHDRFRRVW